MVPTFTCGLVRSNFFFAISFFRPFAESPPRGSNPRPRPYQGRALPTELGGRRFAGHENEVARRNPARLEHLNTSANGRSGGARPPRGSGGAQLLGTLGGAPAHGRLLEGGRPLDRLHHMGVPVRLELVGVPAADSLPRKIGRVLVRQREHGLALEGRAARKS